MLDEKNVFCIIPLTLAQSGSPHKGANEARHNKEDKMAKCKSHLRWAGIMLSSLLAVPVSAAPKLSGFIDTSFVYDLNKPVSRVTNFRSFDRRTDTFLLNAIQINVEGDMKDGIGYYSELAFGTDPSAYKSVGSQAPTEPGLPGAPSATIYNVEVQEAFLTYKCPMTSVMLKAGKFVTQHGIEVIESKDNFTITRGHLFTLAEPYTHTGVLVGYALPKYLDLWVGAVNGWDNYTDNNSGKTLVARLGVNLGEMLTGSFSFLHGAEQNGTTNNTRSSVDTTWFIKPVKMATIGIQFIGGGENQTSIADRNSDGIADGGVGHWYGFGLQPKVDVTDKFFVGTRYEWFSDLDGARTGGTQILQNITLSPGVHMTDNLMARLEWRHDWSTRRVLLDGMGARSDTNTLGAEFIYKF